jgi:hypothetical protein
MALSTLDVVDYYRLALEDFDLSTEELAAALDKVTTAFEAAVAPVESGTFDESYDDDDEVEFIRLEAYAEEFEGSILVRRDGQVESTGPLFA